MRIGVPTEVKNHEYRVALTPAGVHELIAHGHEVYVQRGAGLGSSIPDEDFLASGAAILETADDVWATGDLVLKVKEPIAEEYAGCEPTRCCSPTCTSRRRGPAPTRCSTPAPPPSPMMVSRMKPGSVLVDIAVDQGGCFEDTRATTHADPVFAMHNSLFYCVANLPGAVPHTSTYALTNVTLPYVVELADQGWQAACAADPALAAGLSTSDGALLSAPVAQAHGLPLAAPALYAA